MNYEELEEKYIAQGCTTYSKRSDQYVKGIYPTHVKNGGNKTIVCTNNKKYIDTVCGLGSNLKGWNNNFTFPSYLEPLVAQKVIEKIPFIQKLKFLKTGSAACDAALRIARAYTGKKMVYGTGYHGCGETFISVENPGVGCTTKHYTKFDSFKELIKGLKNAKNVASVIVEPVILDLDVKDELKEIRDICTEKDIVLIFDEVVTSFRFINYCVSNHFKIIPDLICLGKGLGNGYPLAIVGGKEEIMETNDYFISNTHNGETSSLSSALDFLSWIEKEKITKLWKKGKAFKKRMNIILSPLSLTLEGIPTRMIFKGDETVKAVYMQEMCKKMIILGKVLFLNFNHDADTIDKIYETSKQVIKNITKNNIQLEGQLPQELFRRH